MGVKQCFSSRRKDLTVRAASVTLGEWKRSQAKSKAEKGKAGKEK